jgi:hypothetical protein
MSLARLQVALLCLVVLPSTSFAFKSRHHDEITRTVLASDAVKRTIGGIEYEFQPRSINEVAVANVNQDNGWCVFGSPSPPFSVSANHFDGEAFAAASDSILKRIKEIKNLVTATPAKGREARQVLGQVLHAVQDYYAHSSRVERGGTQDSRLGQTVFSADPLSTKECQPPPNTGTFIGNETSGYWFGCRGRDDAQLPANKCYHGLELTGSSYPGTNKDDTGRPGFPAARDLAQQDTDRVVQLILDMPGIAGNKDATRALMGVITLAFAIDDTGSMDGTIDEVKAGVAGIVSAQEGTPEYLLQVFNDPQVGQPFVTTDVSAFLARLGTLEAHEGDDCPELSETGLLRAVEESAEGSAAFLYTDASAKDGGVAGSVTAKAEERDITLNAMLTGSCSPIDPAYKMNTSGTGGQLFFLDPSELHLSFDLVRPYATADFVPVLIVEESLAAASRDFTVPVDSSVRRAVFSVSLDSPLEVSVLRPSGTPVAPSDPGVRINTLTTGAIVSVDAPEVGSWTLHVRGTGDLSAIVRVNSDLAIERFDYVRTGNPKHPGFYAIDGQPLAGSVTALARLRGGATAPAFTLVRQDGTTIQPIDLAAGDPDAAAGDLVGSFSLPSVPFRVVVTGTDGAGNAFQRIVSRLFRGQTVEVVVDTATLPEEVSPGDAVTVGFTAANFGEAATFDVQVVDNRGFVRTVTPSRVFIDAGATGAVASDLAISQSALNGTVVSVTGTATKVGAPETTNSATAVLVVSTPSNAVAQPVPYFTCYKTKKRKDSAAFAPVPGVALTDRFGDSTADVKKPVTLCAPTVNVGDVSSVPDHFESFLVKDSAKGEHPGLVAVDQLGTTTYDTIKADRLLVPTAKDLAGPPAPLPSPGLDHFKCYKVKRPKDSPKFEPITGFPIRDQFGSRDVTIVKPTRLCRPVDKRNEAPGAEAHPDHLTCYKIKIEKDSDAFAKIGPVFVDNQFGPRSIDALKLDELCMWSTVDPHCGDDRVNLAGEVCDGASDAACPGRCLPDCTCAPPPLCGDFIIDPGEVCDPPASGQGCGVGQTCNYTCTRCEDICGDGIIGPDEVCDPPGDTSVCGPGETCSSTYSCTRCEVVCGDGVLGAGEGCDPPGDATGCPAGETCAPGCAGCGVVCGDYVLGPGEVCDPPGTTTGCPAGETCAPGCAGCGVVCGDYVVGAGELCDPPGTTTGCPAGETCDPSCTGCGVVCGDYVVGAAEICDPPGGKSTCGVGLKCDVGCDGCVERPCHDPCTSGLPMSTTCDPCVADVCAANPYCCDYSWYDACAGSYRTACVDACPIVCGDGFVGPGEVCDPPGERATCATGQRCDTTCTTCVERPCHDPCVEGAAMSTTCEPCVASICAADSFCCNVRWDSSCVSEVASVCAETCPRTRVHAPRPRPRLQ